jgi:hypothetical protein
MDSEKILQRYRALMQEIKWRSQIISTAHTFPFPRIGAAAELAYLQLRMICELIALGCLAVHGDVPGSRTARLRTTSKADFIIKALEKLHSNFYPVPCEIRYNLNNQPWAIMDERDADPLPVLDKSSLLSLYYECGSFLHRGDLDFVLPATIRTVKFETIQAWLTKITNLVQTHRIQLADGKEIVVDMRGSNDFAAAYIMKNTGRTCWGF